MSAILASFRDETLTFPRTNTFVPFGLKEIAIWAGIVESMYALTSDIPR